MDLKEDIVEDPPKRGSSRLSKIESKKKIKKRSAPFQVLVAVCRWVSGIHSRAAEERKLYRQEGLYTVADSMPQVRFRYSTNPHKNSNRCLRKNKLFYQDAIS